MGSEKCFSDELEKVILEYIYKRKNPSEEVRGVDFNIDRDLNLQKSLFSEICNAYLNYSFCPADDEVVYSIIERIKIIMTKGVYGIEEAVKVRDGKINNLKQPISSVYGVEFSSDKKVVLFNFFDFTYDGLRCDKNKPIEVSLDLNTGRLFIQKRTYQVERGNRTNVSINTYCLPSVGEVNQQIKRFAQRDGYENIDSIDKLFVCDGFHPGRMDEFVHENQIDKLSISKDEKKLLENYMRKKAPEPHFHIFSDRIALDLGENGKSLAISIADTTRYLNDLMFNAKYFNIDTLTPDVIKNLKEKNKFCPDILQYDLFMPYLSILKGELEYNNNQLVDRIKNLLVEYNGRQSQRISAITSVYSILNSLNKDGFKGQGGMSGIEGLKAIERDMELLNRIMIYLPDELQMSIYEIYNKNFQLNQSFFAKKAEELGIKLPIEVVLPMVTPVQNQVVNNKQNPKTNINN